MKTNKIIAIILIVGGLALGYMGINKVANNEASIEALGLELDVSNESGQTEGYLYIGLAALLFGGGVYTLRKQ